ncbi:MAG: type I DNA topoisomerase [Elusimicrobia bacterium]|nr:type I DNA topoisomerase [Elusimicrobiota bacterium]
MTEPSGEGMPLRDALKRRPGSKRAQEAAKKPLPGRLLQGDCLVIVESPAKQRTISRFLKKGFVVASSYGHVRDLPEKKLGVDEAKDFEPTYALLARTRKLLPELRRLAQGASRVYLATDHDREGESIAWHLVQILELDASRAQRITFHEITPQAIQEALKRPRAVDMDLVQAQQARRVIDRLLGYKISPLLWRKIRRGLSAGRVQSVAVRLLVEREKEINAFKSEPYWNLTARLEKPGQPPVFAARLTQWKGEKVERVQVLPLFSEEYRIKASCFRSQDEIDAVSRAVSGRPFQVGEVKRKDVRRRPQPPFITSTLQQAASQRLGFSADRTMLVAQSLYEGVDIGEEGGEPAGLITYMRTDSVSVAAAAQEEARKFILERHGPEYAPQSPPTYTVKAPRAQEAHEAIRPTSVFRPPEALRRRLSPEQFKLYDLIYRRFLASQMSEAVYDTVSAEIRCGEALFRASGSTMKFDGFLRVSQAEAGAADRAEEPCEDDGEEGEGRLPELKEGDLLCVESLDTSEHHTSPPPYYNEASLIRALERHGIGRPSTYAPTIKTILERGYADRAPKDRRLSPTDLGRTVVEKLHAHFPEQLSLSYTAQVEEQLDEIAEGKQRWQAIVRNFHGPLMAALEKAVQNMEDSRAKPVESDEPCPVCGEKMLIRESRYGKYLSCARFPKCKGKAQLDAQGRRVVLEQTDEKCDLCGKAMVVRLGRKGRFLACSGYPGCRNTYSLDAEGQKIAASRPVLTSRKCNKCGSPMWMRLGKRGHFLACSAFPKCRNIKPLSKEDAGALAAKSAPPRTWPPGASPSPARGEQQAPARTASPETP